ncbi:HLH transcription factor [Akanthomyces lecanii RCEF 1005]|uniref:HLH transcription factor n=1 Tax=Akanthomyces lecanii RCEF 1005 TaxID=1081108 RepID=A0A168KXL3_CORDF|nr:HLH transcription factor [Akanthomyces lecanii RCEF 1005]
MTTDTETHFRFSQTSILESKNVARSADDMRFVQEDLWSQPSEGSAEHLDDNPDMNHEPDYLSAFWHYQSPLEFKMDLMLAEATDSHDENALLYGLQHPPADREALRARKNDELFAGADLSANMAPSLAYEGADAMRRGVSWKCDFVFEAAKGKQLQVTPLSAAAPRDRCQTQRRAPPAESRANWTNHHDKTKDMCSARPIGTGRRRRASGTEEKPQRERLTMEQKRRNHIRHENKRRGLIKDGFECLVNTVPELQGRKWPKSTILSRTAEFLKRVQEGNKRLQLQIAELSRIKDNAR